MSNNCGCNRCKAKCGGCGCKNKSDNCGCNRCSARCGGCGCGCKKKTPPPVIIS